MTGEHTLTEYVDGIGPVVASESNGSTIEESDEELDSSTTSTSVVVERSEKRRIAEGIGDWVDDARELARSLGLDPYEVNYWIVNNEEMNELITYDGFQSRYPHWRWGEKYDRQRKQDQFFAGKAFEIVNNDNPAHAFLQMSNSETDQKAVVTHVEAHADFFKNNRWFRDDPNAAEILSQHADRIEEIMARPDVSRDDVEWLIDTVICIEDHIDQTKTLFEADPLQVEEQREETADRLSNIEDRVEELDLPESIRNQVFDEEWIEEHTDDDGRSFYEDVVGYLMRHGHRFDEETGSAIEFEDWEREIIRMVRDEAYYFAPQRVTKVMNEGWASYWETVMMAYEGFAGDDEFVEYSNHHAMVLDAPGLNPYRLGRELWIHIENQTNRQEVIDKVLRVKGVTPRNFLDVVDFGHLRELLDQPTAYSPARRHYSLARPENRGYIERVDYDDLQEAYRYIADYDRYDSIEEAVNDVDFEAGWKRMREIRATHIDVTFIDEFLDEEFVEERGYFVWDFNPKDDLREVSHIDPVEVKKKLLLQFSNFGKPTIVVEDGNYNNRRELLLTHKYNGIPLDLPQAGDVLMRLAMIWGRPVYLRTVDRRNDDEKGIEVWYDPEEHDEPHVKKDIPHEDWEYLLPDDLDDYWSRPDEWMA